RRFVCWSGQHDCFFESVGTERALDEFLNFTAAFADQPDHDDVRAGIARHHAEEHALADAGAGEQAEPGAAPDGEQRVDRAHADIERRVDQGALHRIDRAAEQGHAFLATEPALAVDGHAGAVDHPPKHLRPDRDLDRAPDRRHARADCQPVAVTFRDQQTAPAVEPDHFGGKLLTGIVFDETALADRDVNPARLHHQTHIAHQAAADLNGGVGVGKADTMPFQCLDETRGRNHRYASSPSNIANMASRQRDARVRSTSQIPCRARGCQRRSLAATPSAPLATILQPPDSMASSATSKMPLFSRSGATVRMTSTSAGLSTIVGAPTSIGTLATASRISFSK